MTVVKLFKELADQHPISSFLNIGFHDYQDIRNRWWIDICRANDIDGHILEIFEPNVEIFHLYAVAADRHRIVLGSIEDIDRLFTRKFDVVFHWHGPEHLEKSKYLDILPKIVARASRMVIVGCPDGPEEQGQAYGNSYEAHLSFWTCAEFEQLGFLTLIVADKPPGHITAFKRPDNKNI